MAINSDIFDVTKETKVNSIALSQQHYENFPVASVVLPKHLREPIALIYTFARQADDFADEGQHKPEWRLANLQGFKDELEDRKSTRLNSSHQ